jgi:hypothetical protein
MFIMAGNGATMREIAAALGFTRNGVIGKYNRERVRRGIAIPMAANRGKHHAQPRRPSIRQPSRSTGVGFIFPAVSIPEPSREGACGIVDVKGCRWPIEESDSIVGGHLFCNATIDGMGSYCPYHARQNVYKAPPKSEVKRFKIPTALLRTGAA